MFTEDLGRDGQFSDVVEKCCPTQPFPIVLVEPQLLGQQFRVGTGPFGVTSGARVVASQGGDQSEEGLCRFRGVVFETPLSRLGHPAGQPLGRPGTHRQPEPGGSPIGKRQGELKEDGEREEAAGQFAGQGQDHQRSADEGCPPPQHRHQSVGFGQRVADHDRSGYRRNNRDHDGQDPDQPALNRM